ncbi:hypothetical protein AX774_g5920 [Zancudomyces culisetae]|uniref:Uncharacterized protein n=1 Tax=Zancudomyces culisetae TaxID=1213189 RepID=A0A1R1PI61_ZANCU|nr:hypothetical protein AX774_g5920 [Zancudomyces culisetae]|eukprot:OMH80638.1 hypothetical protein AX774_g5920 [Zancudomyces culisetae]
MRFINKQLLDYLGGREVSTVSYLPFSDKGVSDSISLEIQVGVIYAIYLVYKTQPKSAKFKVEPVRITLGNWKTIIGVYRKCVSRKVDDCIYILDWLRSNKVFEVTAWIDENEGAVQIKLADNTETVQTRARIIQNGDDNTSDKIGNQAENRGFKYAILDGTPGSDTVEDSDSISGSDGADDNKPDSDLDSESVEDSDDGANNNSVAYNKKVAQIERLALSLDDGLAPVGTEISPKPDTVASENIDATPFSPQSLKHRSQSDKLNHKGIVSLLEKYNHSKLHLFELVDKLLLQKKQYPHRYAKNNAATLSVSNTTTNMDQLNNLPQLRRGLELYQSATDSQQLQNVFKASQNMKRKLLVDVVNQYCGSTSTGTLNNGYLYSNEKKGFKSRSHKHHKP